MRIRLPGNRLLASAAALPLVLAPLHAFAVSSLATQVQTHAPWVGAVLLLVVPMVVLSLRRHQQAPDVPSLGLDWVRMLSEDKFLKASAEGFKRHGYTSEAASAELRTLGVGLKLRKDDKSYLVYSRAFAAPEIEPDVIDALAAAMTRDGADGGLVVSCGAIPDAVRAAAARQRIGLIAGTTMLELANRRGATREGFERREPYVGRAMIQAPDCGVCGSLMVAKSADRISPQEPVWVCSLPRCVDGRAA